MKATNEHRDRAERLVRRACITTSSSESNSLRTRGAIDRRSQDVEAIAQAIADAEARGGARRDN